MFRLLNSPNPLLSVIVRFLNSKDGSIEKIQTLINEATTSQLVPVFAFLGNWLATNPYSADADMSAKYKQQAAFRLIGLISLKVPPVILLNDVFDLNWGMHQPHWDLHEFYKPINERLIRLRSYCRPFSIYAHLIPDFSVFPDKKSNSRPASGLTIESAVDPAYQIAGVQNFKRLIVNHAPVAAFKPLFEQKDSRTMLTTAIMELLRDLNEVPNASHHQLLFSFSSIFLYVHAFAMLNEIDGQLLCEFIQGRPFISPFCALAMINYIPVHHYMFNLLTPRGPADETTGRREIDPSQYTLVDRSQIRQLDPFVAKVPKILSNYILSQNSVGGAGQFDTLDDNGLLSFIHLAPANWYQKMKDLMKIATSKDIGPLHVSGMSMLLLRCITFSLYKTLSDCADEKMFTPTFCNFVKSVFSLLAATGAEQLEQKFYDSKQQDEKLVDLIVRGTLCHLVPLLLHHSSNEHIVLLCLQSMQVAGQYANSAQKISRILVCKMLQCKYPKLSDAIVDALYQTNDAFMILEYIEALTYTTVMETCSEYERVQEVRTKLMQLLGITVCHDIPNLFLINSLSLDKTRFNELSCVVFSSIEQMSPKTSAKDAMQLIKITRETDKELTPFVLRALSMTSFIRNRDFAGIIVDELITMLKITRIDIDTLNRFEVSPAESALPVAQSLLGKLLCVGFEDLAMHLFRNMEPLLKHDLVPIHWMVSFLTQYRQNVPPSVMAELARLAGQLDTRGDRFITGDDLIFRTANLLMREDCVLVQDPETATSEYQSPSEYAQAFANISVSVTSLSEDEIADLLAAPLFDVTRIWRPKEFACTCIARLAATLNSQIAYKFFEKIMAHEGCEMALFAGRIFLMKARIDVFKMICQNARALIGESDVKLDYLMRIVMPSFQRLRDDRDTATALLCGFLESVSETTPREQQEAVIDVMGLIYVKLRLYDARKTLINASTRFAPDLKAIIPSSLDLDFADLQTVVE